MQIYNKEDILTNNKKGDIQFHILISVQPNCKLDSIHDKYKTFKYFMSNFIFLLDKLKKSKLQS